MKRTLLLVEERCICPYVTHLPGSVNDWHVGNILDKGDIGMVGEITMRYETYE